MGQHLVYNGAIKISHKELRTMLKHRSDYQLKQISQIAMHFLLLSQQFVR